jgi:hypothetical protein
MVKITTCSAVERALSDEDWKRVAFNQHRLLWRDDASGTAVLPRRLTGVLPAEGSRVERPEPDHIIVIIPIDF